MDLNYLIDSYLKARYEEDEDEPEEIEGEIDYDR